MKWDFKASSILATKLPVKLMLTSPIIIGGQCVACGLETIGERAGRLPAEVLGYPLQMIVLVGAAIIAGILHFFLMGRMFGSLAAIIASLVLSILGTGVSVVAIIFSAGGSE